MFEEAADTALDFEGFNDNEVDHMTIDAGYKRFRYHGSMVTEGDAALVLRERASVTFNFEHDVFAFGFDLSELNSNSLDYTDSNGYTIISAFEVTEEWDATTFFGVVSDTAIRSFTLTGSGDSSNLYGIDAMQFTAAPVEVSEPPVLVLLLSVLALSMARQRRTFKR